MKRALCLILIILILLPVFSLLAFGEEDSEMIKIQSYNLPTYAAGISLYDKSYGKSTGNDDRYYEITVQQGCVTKTGGYNNDIPEEGFVVAARGERYQALLKDVSVGAYCIFDSEDRYISFLGDDFDPFFTNEINFDKYNSTRTSDTIVIYNKGEKTNTNVWGYEVTVNKDGFVEAVGGNDNAIPEGGMVISAVGRERIAELTEAAAIGLKVHVDDNNKSVIFSYNGESICASARIKLESAKKQLDNAKTDYLLIDVEKANQQIQLLEGLYNGISEGIENDDIAKAVALSYSFDNCYDSLYLYLCETPAVEGRAMWLRPAGLNSIEAVSKAVTEVKEMGFNIICLELFYDSTFICPMPEDGYVIQNPSLNGFDQLQAFIDECAKQGVELQGWLPVFRVSYSTSTYYNDSLAAKKPEWLCISKKGADCVVNEYGNGYFIDPSNKEATDYLLTVYEYILTNYKLDGLQLDYIRYPSQTGEDFGYNESTREAFEAKYGKDPINLNTNDELWDDWISFRCNFVTEFVKEIYAKAEQLSPMTTVSCDVAPNLTESFKSHLQDASLWMKDHLIDMAYPMAYGTAVVSMYTKHTVDACGDKVMAYIGLGDYGVDVFVQQILETRKAGANGFAFFSYAQYKAGGYGNKIATTVLSTPAISPTYDCRAAAIAQLETITKRLDLIKDHISESEYNNYINEIQRISVALENGKLSELSDDIQGIVSNVPNVSDDKALSKLESDLKLLNKIVTVNRDDHRNFIYTQYDESDQSNDESAEDLDGKGSNWKLIAIICGLVIVCVATVVLLLKLKK